MEFSARTIAEIIGGTVEGNENVTINSFAKIEEGHEKALSFLANPKYTPYIYETKSSVVLVANDFAPEHPVKTTLIRVADPYAALSTLLSMVNDVLNRHPEGIENPCFIADDVTVPENAYIGAFAYVGKGVKLGKGVKIYPQVYIGEGVCIGDNTVIYAGVKLYKNTKIGNNCIIHSGAVIGADGFGFAPLPDGTYKKIPQLGNVEIGNDVEIGANTTVDRATMGSSRIGDGTKLDNLIQLAHNVTIGKNTAMAAQVGVAGSTHIGDNCVLAGQVGVAGHIKVGNRVSIGAQSGIPNDVEDNSQIMGYPAVPYGTFARQTVMIKRLSELFERVKQLEIQTKAK